MNGFMLWVWPIIVHVGVMVIVFMCRKWFVERLSASIRHEYNTRLSTLRAEQERELVLIKADLQTNASKLQFLSSNGIASLSSRKDKLFERRLSAIDTIWQTIGKARSGVALAHSLAHMNVDEVFKETENKPELAAKFELYPGFKDADKIEYFYEAELARPYVSILTWAYYKAFRAIVTHASVTAVAIKGSLPQRLIGNTGLKEILKTAIPELSESISASTPSQLYNYIDLIESKLLNAIKEYDLKGLDLDDEVVNQASEIIKKAEELQTNTTNNVHQG